MSWLSDVGHNISSGFKDIMGQNEPGNIAEDIRRSRENAEKRSKELYEQYKIDPTAMQEKFRRSLQQQAGGFSAALAGSAGLNPAMAAHLIGRTQAEMGAKEAGEEEMAMFQLDAYNKQLMQNVRQQEIQQSFAEQQAIANARQQAQARMNNLFSSIATIGATIGGAALAGPFGAAAGSTTGGSLFGAGAGAAGGPGGLGINTSMPSYTPSNPYLMQGYQGPYSDERLKTSDYDHEPMHLGLASMFTGDHSDSINEVFKPRSELKNPSPDEMQEFEASLMPKEYYYKKGSVADDGGKAHVGPIAQKLEESSIGKNAVEEDEQGNKMISIPELTKMLASGIYDLNKRLKSLEGRA